jgi:CBS domain-containing protein
MLPITEADGTVAGVVTDRDLVVRAMVRAADQGIVRALDTRAASP